MEQVQELKKRMTFEEMATYFEEMTGKFATRVSVGKYARKLGYQVYKPMINGKLGFFYINENIGKQPAALPISMN